MSMSPRFAEDFEPTYGKYRLVEKVAAGGMAEVFRATSTSIGGFQKTVAVKRILPQLSTDAEFVSLFIDEAKLTVSLSHSNIVQVFDFGRIENNYYIAMEFVDGRDMTRILIKQTRLGKTVPIDVGCYIIAMVLRGLEYANTRRGSDGEMLGIVHRDVSPHNILVSFDGEVKIADFGIAKARTKVSLTRPGVVLGKFAYMSPEQARGDDVDARSDVYSSGIALFETVTGRRLFYAENPADVLLKVRDPHVPTPSRYNPLIPSALDEIILKALAPRRSERYQSCRDFSTALEAFLVELSPGFNDSHLVRFMKELFEDEVGSTKFTMAATHPIEPSHRRWTSGGSMPLAVRRKSTGRDGDVEDAVLLALYEKLRQRPDLWTLYEIAQTLMTVGRAADAHAVYRAAASKFAQQGLLAQAVTMFVQLRAEVKWDASLALEVEAMRELPGCRNETLLARLPRIEDEDLRSLVVATLDCEAAAPGASEAASPLFSDLDAAEFANIVSLLCLKDAPVGGIILREGDPGDWLGVIARGRVVVYCESQGTKIYLSSLSDGDCVGEFSFFSGASRAATVEALEPVLYLAIDRADFDRLSARFPGFTKALASFYRRRVVANMLAKSEVFGVLRPRDRAALVETLIVESFKPGAVIVSEGEQSDSFYLLQSGAVEVYSDRPGVGRIQRLSPGAFFGEIGAVTGQSRNASVRALADSEVLRISGEAIARIIKAHPEARRVLEQHIAARQAETALRVTGGGTLI